ncbi:hypothetical protein RFI_38241 [Reticulomyxa filosa]|uniref:Uncharacterized protein n=1 Tax=Reticulomyxa filosa TaxID=46433 RepID=X6LCY2_RETFI|nr:hypothetical protein RFI_38241 [Reticulomyxa filosa]|eukprot:ETN99240.1 hypothetical protein RFI_38241 [Reticulomyxa filosa]
MFEHGKQVAIESDFQYENNAEVLNSLDPTMEKENEKIETKINEITTSKKYFNGDSISKYVLRRTGDNKYQFLHKSCQEYYAAQKIIFDIILWKPNTINFTNQEFQQFEINVSNLLLNRKLLNEELGILKFMVSDS